MLKVIFWPFLEHFSPFWALLGQNLGHPPHRHIPNCAKTSARMFCNSFHAIPTVWDHQSAQSQILAIFCHFWTILVLFGRSWAKIWDTSPTDTLPTVPKPYPGCPVTCSKPIQPFGTIIVLKVRFWPFLDFFGPFWPFLGAPLPKLGRPSHSQLGQNFNKNVL